MHRMKFYPSKSNDPLEMNRRKEMQIAKNPTKASDFSP